MPCFESCALTSLTIIAFLFREKHSKRAARLEIESGMTNNANTDGWHGVVLGYVASVGPRDIPCSDFKRNVAMLSWSALICPPAAAALFNSNQGTILIAVNPLRRVPDPEMSEYVNRPLNPETPHPYAIAEVTAAHCLCSRSFVGQLRQPSGRQGE